MKRVNTGVLAALISVSPALGVNFSETFDPGWFDGSTWTREGVALHETTVPVTTFDPADSRLGASNGSHSGGFYNAVDVTGVYDGGGNGEVMIDYHMSLPAGEYYFDVNLDAQVNWINPEQPWGMGMEFYIGDASRMDYGFQLQGSAPFGPWKGQKWQADAGNAGAEDDTLLPAYNGPTYNDNTLWNGGEQGGVVQLPDINGMWVGVHHDTFKDGSNTITTTGDVIFRMLFRDKHPNTENVAVAMDNLDIELTMVPEPASAVLLLAGGVVCLARRRRV